MINGRVTPPSVVGGTPVTGTIVLNGPPPSNAQAIVTSTNPGAANPTSPVTLTGTETSFEIDTFQGETDQVAEIGFEYKGSQTVNVTVLADCNRNGTHDQLDIASGAATDCNGNAILDVCDVAQNPGRHDCDINGIIDCLDIAQGDSTDCNGNDLPDKCDLENDILGKVNGSFGQFFGNNRANQTYQNMIAAYGKPWEAGTDQTPELDDLDPASRLRAFGAMKLCVSTELAQNTLRELHGLESLLGNEAFSDAMDRTIGSEDNDALGELHAFQGVPGISSLLAEELALLRGREIPLPETADQPFEDTQDTYPAYPGEECLDTAESPAAAVYNRLPPNADSIAYKSNYGSTDFDISDNGKAACRFPQGHGDAYGYYLGAMKVYMDAFRGDPEKPADDPANQFARAMIQSQAADNEKVAPDSGDMVAVPYDAVRRMANAMAARARTAVQIVDLTFRRDYRENPEDPAQAQVLEDADRERAWGTADWARRSGLGAYIDWAVVNQLLPAPLADAPEALTAVHRESVNEVAEIASTLSEMQERVDMAGAGLNPMGLLPNVVPFGIRAGELANRITGGAGKSHYEQIRDMAVGALDNARTILEWANRQEQRLREQGEARNTFDDQLVQSEIGFTNQLVEIFGNPSASDPADNDFQDNDGDGAHTAKDDEIESSAAPDLVNFLLDEKEVQRREWQLRSAPGQIQLAMSDLRIAELHGDAAEAALSALEVSIDDQLRFIELLTETSAEEVQILKTFGEEEVRLLNELKRLKARRDWWSQMKPFVDVVGGIAGAVALCAGTGGGACVAAAGAAAGAPGDPTRGQAWSMTATGALGSAVSAIEAMKANEQLEGEFDIQLQRQRIVNWRDVELAGIRNREKLAGQDLELQNLVRQMPQLHVNLAIQAEKVFEAAGRLNAATQVGHRLVQQRARIRELQRNQLVGHRWKDLAFRVFRNNALQKYDQFFDLAARYVSLAARSFAYEFTTDREWINQRLQDVQRMRHLGSLGTSGLQGIIAEMDARAEANEANSPFEVDGLPRTFSLRRNLLGLSESAEDDRAFRAWVESQIVQRLEDVPEMQDLAQLLPGRDPGPAIVIRFPTEVANRNFFGKGPEARFGFDRFSPSRNIKILKYAIEFEGVDATALGIFDPIARLEVFFMPIGQSIFRENNNQPEILELPRPWAVVDQWLPTPAPIAISEVLKPTYNPWVETADANGNYLNAIKRFKESSAQIGTGQPSDFRTDLAGRSAWNSEWLLVIPASWRTSENPDAIREDLKRFIYGPAGNPDDDLGIRDIHLIIEAYKN